MVGQDFAGPGATDTLAALTTARELQIRKVLERVHPSAGNGGTLELPQHGQGGRHLAGERAAPVGGERYQAASDAHFQAVEPLIATIAEQHRHQEWLAFLKKIDREISKDLDIHLIADNYATTHKHAEVKAWCTRIHVSHALHTDLVFLAQSGGMFLPRRFRPHRCGQPCFRQGIGEHHHHVSG